MRTAPRNTRVSVMLTYADCLFSALQSGGTGMRYISTPTLVAQLLSMDGPAMAQAIVPVHGDKMNTSRIHASKIMDRGAQTT